MLFVDAHPRCLRASVAQVHARARAFMMSERSFVLRDMKIVYNKSKERERGVIVVVALAPKFDEISFAFGKPALRLESILFVSAF